MAAPPATNPFRFGALALDEAFADRERELAEIAADALAGQDVVLLAPRRFGKSSLMWRAAQRLVKARTLVAQVDLMTTPTLPRFAEKLAQTIHEDIASPLFRARERLRVFQGLRVTPTVTIDPDDASISFGFSSAAGAPDILATVERLLELPGQLAGERGRRVVLVLDEFQEIADIDRGLPRLMRAVFQRQPEVAHIYLGSRRHAMERIFNDENEPFWRSAKRMELGLISPEAFGPFLTDRFTAGAKQLTAPGAARLLEVTGGHPYATQELSYFAWQRTPPRGRATAATIDEALGDVLRSEDAHFTSVWERSSAQQRAVLAALAHEPGRPMTSDYRRRHDLPSPSSVQRALQFLEQGELIRRTGGSAEISEPFLAAWLRAKGL
ncbi:MAG TPA: ATP-binding protein [Solirubrobacteraceae bacterium]|nr:ATP-binding protein [Solirubrobacteraceae bacterium]